MMPDLLWQAMQDERLKGKTEYESGIGKYERLFPSDLLAVVPNGDATMRPKAMLEMSN